MGLWRLNIDFVGFQQEEGVLIRSEQKESIENEMRRVNASG